MVSRALFILLVLKKKQNIRHYKVFEESQRLVLGCVFEMKKLSSKEDTKEKETHMGQHRGSPEGWSPYG